MVVETTCPEVVEEERGEEVVNVVNQENLREKEEEEEKVQRKSEEKGTVKMLQMYDREYI